MEENANNTVPPVTTTPNKNNNGDTTATVPEVTTTMTVPQGGGNVDSVVKKRGRPRKYDSYGKLNVQYHVPKSSPGFAFSPTSSAFTNWQLLSPSFREVLPNRVGEDFIPYVVTVDMGEDVCVKIMSFAQNGPGGICILAANGAVSNVAIRQPGSSGGTLTYEGHFEILSLSGSFTLAENSDMRVRSGGLSVSLSAPDGRTIGGAVAGLLTAAAPIQIVMGRFIPNGNKTHKKKGEHALASHLSPGPDTVAEAKSILQSNPNNVDGENFPISEQSQKESASVTTDGDTQNQDATPNVATLNGSEEFSDQMISPDTNVS